MIIKMTVSGIYNELIIFIVLQQFIDMDIYVYI